MFDLDHFKLVNDEHGHAAGDRALVAVAEAATVAVGDQGMVSRLGGEEFAVVVHRGADVLEELLARVLERVRPRAHGGDDGLDRRHPGAPGRHGRLRAAAGRRPALPRQGGRARPRRPRPGDDVPAPEDAAEPT